MNDNWKGPSENETSASEPLVAADLPEPEQTVTEDEATDVRGGVTKVDPVSVKWELSEFDAARPRIG